MDVDVQRPRIAHVIRVPDLSHDRLTFQNLIGMGHKQRDEFGQLGVKLDFLARRLQDARGVVEQKGAAAKGIGQALLQHSRHDPYQLAAGKRRREGCISDFAGICAVAGLNMDERAMGILRFDGAADPLAGDSHGNRIDDDEAELILAGI